MEVYIKIKFNSDKNKIESFGNWRYLAYTKLGTNEMSLFIEMLSDFLSVPSKSVKNIGKKGDTYIFEVR